MHQMLAAHISQLLQTVLIRKKKAEPLHREVVSLLSSKARLPVVSCQFIQLGHETEIDAWVL